METTNEHHGGSDGLVDPLSHLALLNRSARAPRYEAFLNFAWWHPPLWATYVGGLALGLASIPGSAEVGRTSPTGGVIIETHFGPLFAVIAALAAVALSADGFRRREVKPRPSLLGAGLTVIASAIAVAAVVAWNVAILIVGYQEFLFVWAAVGWVLTTAFFVGFSRALNRFRKGQRVAAP